MEIKTKINIASRLSARMRGAVAPNINKGITSNICARIYPTVTAPLPPTCTTRSVSIASKLSARMCQSQTVSSRSNKPTKNIPIETSRPGILQSLRNIMATKIQNAPPARDTVVDDIVDLDTLFDPIDAAEQKRTMELPQHFEDGSTNTEWLRARLGVMTGSRVSNVVGHGFSSKKKFLQQMVWPGTHTVNRIFCDYGLGNEQRCEDVLKQYLALRVANRTDPLASFKIVHCGVVRSMQNRSRGYSPDGYVVETYTDGTSCVVLAEYKCPYTKRWWKKPANTSTHINYFKHGDDSTLSDAEIKASCLYGPTQVPPKPYTGTEASLNLPITTYYYDQVQWGMDIMSKNNILRINSKHTPVMHCYFAVWTPRYTQICSVPYNPAYASWLSTKVTEFMRNEYIPAMRLKQSGELETGHTEFTLHL